MTYCYDCAANVTAQCAPGCLTSDEDGPEADDESLCPACEGDGSDKWSDYCLPCEKCGGDGRLW